mmetsp:Transcript_4106/g.12866  ORF Transcript_4106/g.12866 Transcript_4106/m.12866 type:complete len:312 (+) Transcript_4106:304-1239(+)
MWHVLEPAGGPPLVPLFAERCGAIPPPLVVHRLPEGPQDAPREGAPDAPPGRRRRAHGSSVTAACGLHSPFHALRCAVRPGGGPLVGGVGSTFHLRALPLGAIRHGRLPPQPRDCTGTRPRRPRGGLAAVGSLDRLRPWGARGPACAAFRRASRAAGDAPALRCAGDVDARHGGCRAALHGLSMPTRIARGTCLRNRRCRLPRYPKAALTLEERGKRRACVAPEGGRWRSPHMEPLLTGSWEHGGPRECRQEPDEEPRPQRQLAPWGVTERGVHSLRILEGDHLVLLGCGATPTTVAAHAKSALCTAGRGP